MCCGLPYPNPADPELAARMAFLDTQPQPAAAQLSGDSVNVADARQGQGAAGRLSPGRQHYEDLCMKAVNQCVGRVLRSRTDWAAILLADARWSAPAGMPSSPSRLCVRCAATERWCVRVQAHTRGSCQPGCGRRCAPPASASSRACSSCRPSRMHSLHPPELVALRGV